MDQLNRLAADPQLRPYLAILKGARNGFVYGVKVRFPHALIMAILFGRGTYVQSNLASRPCRQNLAISSLLSRRYRVICSKEFDCRCIRQVLKHKGKIIGSHT